jgi:hypothetical protein
MEWVFVNIEEVAIYRTKLDRLLWADNSSAPSLLSFTLIEVKSGSQGHRIWSLSIGLNGRYRLSGAL